MVELVVVGIVAGFLAGISPCILPVLPGAGGGGRAAAEPRTPGGRGRRQRARGGRRRRTGARGLAQPLAVIAGLVLSFSLLILVGSAILSLLHLPQDSLRNAGIALLILVGLGYLIPPLGALIERPFARLGTRRPAAARRFRARPGPRPAVRAVRGPGARGPSPWSGPPTGSG